MNTLKVIEKGALSIKKIQKVLPEGGESLGEKIYRWIDFSGYLTRYNCRKTHVMHKPPHFRSAHLHETEWERKMREIMLMVTWVTWPPLLFGAAYTFHHLLHRNPMPEIPPEVAYMENRKQDFFFHPILDLGSEGRCGECRLLDTACRRLCFDRLREEGIMDAWGYSRPFLKYHPRTGQPS
eukprot:GHVL01002413.1.p1 GENE.GHVL01002413.1~~GHVL01002413.1.p1  ORF type:complete len:181 (-),score=34.49 GHVL01002413.1:108-650(-)